MSRRFWFILIAIVVIFGVIYKFQAGNSKTTSNSGAKGTSHVLGKGSTGITLVEWGDYECPYCAQYAPFVKQAQAAFNDKIYFQFRNLPLTQIHPNALQAARAAEAAGLQNKFWEMHDALYSTQQSWASLSNPTSVFVNIAKQLGLNTTQFNSDMNSETVNNLINGDKNDFAKTGFEEGTPTFTIDGKQVKPNGSVESISAFIQNAIDKKQGKKTTTTTTSGASNQSVQAKPTTKQ